MTTLQDYLDDNSVDLVDSILTDPEGNAYSYSEKAGKAIWATYRYAMMNCRSSEKSITRWIQRGRDMVYNLDERYAQLFTAYEALKTAGKPTSIDMTDSGTTTTDATGDSAGTDKRTDTNEVIPQYADASQDSWLNSRAVSDGSSSGTTHEESTTTYSNTVTGGNLPIELMNRMKDGLFNPYLDFARALSDLWVPFFVDEGCDCL